MGVASDMPTLCAAITYSTDEQGQHRFRLHYPDNTSIRQQLIPYQSYYAFDKYNSDVRKQREAYHLYSRCSYSFLQNWIANAVLRNETGIWDASIASLTLPMKLDNLREDGGFIEFQEHLFPLCILLMFLIPILRLVQSVVSEERNSEKLMFKQQFGMSELQYMLSLLIAYLLVTSVISVIFMLITKYEVLLNSNAFLIFAFYELYALALFGFAVLLSYIFILMGISSSVSQILLVLCYFVSFFCDQAVNSPYFVSETRRILGCFFPSVAMKRAIFNIIVFEKSGIGLQYSNFQEVYYNFRVENSFYMFAATFAIGTSLGLLLNSFRNLKVSERISKYLQLRRNKSKIGILTSPQSESPSNSTQRLNLLSSQREGLILNATNQVAEEGLDQNMNFPVDNANIIGEQCNHEQAPLEEGEYNTQGFQDLKGEERIHENNMALGVKKRVQKSSRNEASKEDKTGVGLGESPTAHGQGILSDRNKGLTDFKSQEVIRFDTQTARQQHKDDETLRTQKEEANKCVSTKRVAFDTEEEKQPDDADAKANLKISNLSKTFPGSESPAINNLNLNLYTGEIFAILGHNGAGKSTVIDIISGILQPNFGSIALDGIDLLKDPSYMKENIAICSASDQLIPNITVNEHLEIFCKALGADIEDIEQIRASLLTEINNFSFLISDLSVGQRRLLQVALTFLGDKRVILLDDPYYGLDRNAKKRLWDFLLKNKADRIILLTTVNLEEIQQFGDRVAILHEGELIQVGPPLTLLSNFEYGYSLTVTLKNTEQQFMKFLEQHLTKSDYSCSSLSGQVLQILIKKECQREIIKMLQCLDDQSEELGIECYQIGTASLSEVIRVIDRESKTLNRVEQEVIVNDDAKNYTSQVKINPDISDLSTKDAKTSSGMRRLYIRISGLLSQRTINARQNWRSFLVETLLPPLVIAIGFAFQSIKFDFTSPPRTFSTDLFTFQEKQRLLVNSYLIKSIGTNSSTDLLYAESFFNDNFNSSYFNLVPINLTQQNNSSNYTERDFLDYMEEMIDEKSEMSEQQYGSYILYEANNVSKQFKFASFLNLTAQESTVLYPQMMYDSIIKEATGNPNLQFKLTTVPLKVGSNEQSDEASLIKPFFAVLVIAIGFSLIPAFVVLHGINYNNEMLFYAKDQGPATFLLVNLFFDICKAMIPSAITIGILAAFNLSIEAWRVFLIFPFAIVPFTYSFMLLPFQKAHMAAFIIFLHIAVSGIGVIMVTLFRMVQETYTLGDALVWAFKIIPSFCLTNPIMYSSSKDRLFALRPELYKGDLGMSLIGGDMAVLAGHFGFWIIILIITEKVRSIAYQRIIEDEQLEITKNSSNLIQLRSIRIFSNKEGDVLVDDKNPIIDVTVKEGDSIAIFGNNGSGKSTLLQCIAKQLKPKFGTIQSKQSLMIGYCPQSQERNKEQMTVQQFMNIKGKLSGIPLEIRMKEIGYLLNFFQFEKLKDEKLASLPSHEQRKLQIALALIGEPDLILLDEPTIGLTQDQQDIVWNALQKWKADHKKPALVIASSQPTVVQQFKPVAFGALSKNGYLSYNMSELQKSGFSGYHIQLQFRSGTKNQIQTMKKVFGIESSELRVSDMEKLMQSNGVSEFLISELQKGAHYELWKEVLQEASGGASGMERGFVTADTFFNTLHILKNLCLLISHLAKYFINGIEIIDIHGPNVIFSLDNDQGSSVGQIFDLISELNSMPLIINSFDIRETSHSTLAIKASLGKDIICKRGYRIFMRKGQIMRIQDYNEPSSIASNTHQKLEESKLQHKSSQLEGSFKSVNLKSSARQQSFSPVKVDNRPFSDCTDAPVSLGPSGVPDGESVMSKEKMELLNEGAFGENYQSKQVKEQSMTVIQSPKQQNVSFLPPIQMNNRLQSQNQLQFFIDY